MTVYVLIEVYENEDGQQVLLSSDLFFFDSIKNFDLRRLKYLRAISNGKAELLFDNAQNINSFLKTKIFGRRDILSMIRVNLHLNSLGTQNEPKKSAESNYQV
uniref:Uncharacterized protein n=1 Tax=Glossina austeni TaxID=7395 RepID=A0A1A9V565_GLOAU